MTRMKYLNKKDLGENVTRSHNNKIKKLTHTGHNQTDTI